MGVPRSTNTTSTIHRNLVINRLQRRYGEVRYLWWWGKHGRAWWSSQVEDVEERMRRHQTIMMHRYSKALRRRAMWERDDSPPSWAWRLPAKIRAVRMDRKAMSSTEQMQAKMEEHEKSDNTRRPWEEYHQDFESFKAAVDKAIERDPHGTLFGRRLRSPPTSNNSSWTSWSWIFDPKEIKEDTLTGNRNKNETGQSLSSKKYGDESGLTKQKSSNIISTTHTVSSSKTETTVQPRLKAKVDHEEPGLNEEYIYDPISGRKIVNKQTLSKQQNFFSPTTSKGGEDTPPKKSIFSALFSEHGVDIPVKTYKPHKVFGYTGDGKSESGSSKSTQAASPGITKGFESSRKREYQQLRAAMLGNHIDTTAEFGGKYESEASATTKSKDAPEEKTRASSSLDDNAAPFSGTTYASRVVTKETASKSPNSQWLVKEGFKTKQGLTIPSLQSDEPFRGPIREPPVRLEPALDRTNARSHEIPVKIFGTKLQPSIDRVTSKSREEIKSPKHQAVGPAKTLSETELGTDKREDIDLLRASDVRAAARMARMTKQQKEEGKQERRAKLEKDFVARHENDEVLESTSQPLSLTTDKLSTSLTNVWKHIKEYPSGIVAKTMQNMGLASSENWKKYVRPDSRSEELLKPLDFKDENLSSSPSIYKKQRSSFTAHGSTPTAETIAFEENTKKRGEELRLAAQQATEAAKATDEKIRSLAREMKNLYEAEHGEITVKHRQSVDKVQPQSILSLRNPTVKPGVVRDLQMERHVGVFEPKYADLVDKAKSIKRGLHEVSLSIGDIENERTIASIAARDASLAIKAQSIKAQATAPVVQEQEAPILKDAATQQTHLAFDSPYILLSFNSALGVVQLTPLRTLMGTIPNPTERINPIAVISSLNNATAFVKHFAELDKNGYELSNGAGDVLFFRKKDLKPASSASTKAAVSSRFPEHGYSASLSSSAELRRTVAAAEAAAQPKTEVSKSNALNQDDKKAATVLDEIPADVPTPGPAAPTAPPLPSSSSSIGSRFVGTANRHKGSNKVRRQEEVFSGQRRSQPISPPPPPRQPEADQSSSSSSSGSEQAGVFTRIRRLIRRTIFTALAFGSGAYAIGVVAEALGAQAQIEDGEVIGPRTKVVLPPPPTGQRSGIFSTESSR